VFLSWSEYWHGFSQFLRVKPELYEQICSQRPRPPGRQTPNITADWSSILWKLHTVWQQWYQASRFRTLVDTAIIICQQIKLITCGLLKANVQDTLIPVIKEAQLHSDVWRSKDIAPCMLSHSDHLLAGSISLRTLYCNPSHHESPTNPTLRKTLGPPSEKRCCTGHWECLKSGFTTFMVSTNPCKARLIPRTPFRKLLKIADPLSKTNGPPSGSGSALKREKSLPSPAIEPCNWRAEHYNQKKTRSGNGCIIQKPAARTSACYQPFTV
jgi:hypothetical protein